MKKQLDDVRKEFGHQKCISNIIVICLANGDATMGVAAELAFFSTDCLINSATCVIFANEMVAFFIRMLYN
ncbi:Tryptophan synthase beta chain [Trichinella pseudospiralis]